MKKLLLLLLAPLLLVSCSSDDDSDLDQTDQNDPDVTDLTDVNNQDGFLNLNKDVVFMYQDDNGTSIWEEFLIFSPDGLVSGYNETYSDQTYCDSYFYPWNYLVEDEYGTELFEIIENSSNKLIIKNTYTYVDTTFPENNDEGEITATFELNGNILTMSAIDSDGEEMLQVYYKSPNEAPC